MLFLCLAKINIKQKVQSKMHNKRQQSISSYLNSQIEPKKVLRRLEGTNYQTDLCFTQHSNKSNASEERQQLNVIEDVLNNFFKGESIVRKLIAKIDNSTIRNQFDKVAVQYFTSKDSFKQKEREINNVMAEVNHHLSASLKNQWPYQFKLKNSSQFIDLKLLKEMIKDLNEHKLCKIIINNNQQLKFNEYSNVLKIDSYRFLTKINNLVSNKVSTAHLKSDFLHSLKQVNAGKYKEDQSLFRHFSKQIHQQLLRLDSLLRHSTKQQSKSGIDKSLSPSKGNKIQEEQLNKSKNRLSQVQILIENKLNQLQRADKEFEKISIKLGEAKRETERWQKQQTAIKEKALLLGNKYKVIEVLQEEKKALQNTINQLTKQQKIKQQMVKALKSDYKEQQLKKNHQITFYKQQLKEKDKKLSQFDFEYKSLLEKYTKLSNQKEYLLSAMSTAKQESLKRLEMRQVKAAQEISQKQANLADLKKQCQKNDQELKRVNISLSELTKQYQENSKLYQREIAEKETLLREKDQQIKGLTDQNELFIKKEQKLQRIIEGKEKENQDLLKKLNEKTLQQKQNKQRNEVLFKEKQALTIRKKHAFERLLSLSNFSSVSEEQIASIKTNLLDFKEYFTKQLKEYVKTLQLIVSQNENLKLSLEQMMKKQDQNTVVHTEQPDHQILQQKNDEILRLNQLIDSLKAQISQKDIELQDNQKEKEQITLLLLQNQRLQSTVNDIHAQRRQEKSILQSLRRQNEILNQELELSKNLTKDAQQRFSDLFEKQNRENEKAIAQLKQRLESESADKDEQQMQKIASLTVAMNDLTKANESNLQTIASMESTLNQIYEQNEQLKAKNASLSALNDKLTEEKQAIQKQLNVLSQKYKSILDENRQLLSRISQAQSQSQLLEQYKTDFKQLSSESSAHVNKNNQLMKQLQEIRQQLTIKKDSNLKMAQLAQENSNICKHLQGQKQQLQKDLIVLRAKESNISTFTPEQKKKLQKKIQQYKEQNDELTRQIECLNQNMDDVNRMNLENYLQTGKAQKLKLQQEKAKWEQLCHQLTQKNNAKNQEILQQQQQIKKLRKEVEQLTEKFRDLQEQNSTLVQSSQRHIEDLEKKITAIEQQHAQTRKKQKDSKTQCDLLNAKFEAIQSQYYEMKRGINSKISQMGSSDIANDLLFQNDVLEGQLGHKKYLRQTIQNHMGLKIWKSRLIFRFDVQNKVNFHRYIDSKEHLVIVMKLKNGNYLAAYTEGSFQPQKITTQEALIVSLTNQETFKLIDKNKRSITYDEYFLIFGNSEIRIRSQENKVFSNFAITNGYFETRGKKVPILLGGGPSDRELQFQHYEIYQLDVLYDL